MKNQITVEKLECRSGRKTGIHKGKEKVNVASLSSTTNEPLAASLLKLKLQNKKKRLRVIIFSYLLLLTTQSLPLEKEPASSRIENLKKYNLRMRQCNELGHY
tara:strand:- start:214 stop:522 length:309 start_codon:yes stop_codon:yes gene_type:complete